jgi:hypothetical protein
MVVNAFVSLGSKWWAIWRIVGNVLALGEEADFEALNCLPALNLIRSTKLHLSTEPAFFAKRLCVCPVWASDIEDITLFQRVQVPYRQVGKAC